MPLETSYLNAPAPTQEPGLPPRDLLHRRDDAIADTAWQVFQLWTASRDTDRFRTSFYGHYADRAQFGAELLAGLGAQARLERLPPWLQAYLRFDYDAVITDFVAAGHLYVYDVPDGSGQGCYVFDGSG